MNIKVTLVNVKDGKELTKAIVADDGHITYDPDDDILPAIFDRLLVQKMDSRQAAQTLNRDGWSNGYIMIKRS